MAIQISLANPPQRRWPRSVGAVFAGFVAVVALSLGVDQVLHMTGVYPPWGQPMHDPVLFLLALAYRCVFGLVGGYVTAKLAPYAPVGHALALGIFGLIPSIAGAAATIGNPDLGPAWYPVALVISSVPCAFIGGMLRRRPAR